MPFPYSDCIDCQVENCQDSVGHDNMAVLLPTFRLMHAFLHSDMVDRNYELKKIDLRQLYEMSRIVANYDSQINWGYIEDVFKTHKVWKQFYCRLSLMDALFKVHPSVLKKNQQCVRSLKLFYMFFEDSNTFLANLFTNYHNFLFALSYRRIRSKYGVSTKKEYIYSIFRQLKKGLEKLKS